MSVEERSIMRWDSVEEMLDLSMKGFTIGAYSGLGGGGGGVSSERSTGNGMGYGLGGRGEGTDSVENGCCGAVVNGVGPLGSGCSSVAAGIGVGVGGVPREPNRSTARGHPSIPTYSNVTVTSLTDYMIK